MIFDAVIIRADPAGVTIALLLAGEGLALNSSRWQCDQRLLVSAVYILD